ncbi:MAG TPA: heavy-metal-associated domain-containing protein [Phycisphaerales bacterium]|nr:heavy-metal-associated domain-containing protein [Phycisphaerales bacterium]
METTLSIDGMSCGNCVRRLTDAFSKVPGVTSAHVTLSPPEAHLSGSATLADLQAAASAAGPYTVRRAADGAPATNHPQAAHAAASPAAEVKKASLYPLVLIVGYIGGTVLTVGFARSGWRVPDWHGVMLDFMAGFFLVFSFFKLLDLRGFADAYQGYDVLARRVRIWAFAYPFIELALGVAYLTRWNLPVSNSATLLLMVLGSVGVLRALLKKNAIRCACLGTALNLPMTTVTLVEDLGMAAMAAAGLIWSR